jgi:hypothetical protein
MDKPTGSISARLIEKWYTIHHVQARRIDCEHCRHPYVYLVGENLTGDATTGIGETADADARTRVQAVLMKGLCAAGLRERYGHGLCPHCRRYQMWMVRDSIRRQLGMCVVLGLVAGGAAMVMSAGIVGEITATMAVLCFTIGALSGALAGRLRAISVGPHDELLDRLSVPDDEVTERLGMDRRDPQAIGDRMLAWYLGVHPEARDQGEPMFLGWVDSADTPADFALPTTEQVLAELERTGIVAAPADYSGA